MPTVSAIMIVKNEADNIGPCLESVRWADEILVADEMSTDATARLCGQFPNARIYPHTLEGEGAKRNFILSKASGEWILAVDADERITSELKAEILRRMGREPVAGYYVRMKYPAFGRWVTDARPMNPRLFRRAAGKFSDRMVHSAAVVDGPMGCLDEPVLHLSSTYKTLAGYLAKQNTYTSYEAMDLQRLGRRVTPANLALYFIIKPAAIFVRKYLRWGRRYGLSGFLLSALTAYEYFLSYAKLWEMQKTSDNSR